MIYDLHIHSMYSKDSNLKPSDILRIAKKKKLSGIAITDHHSIRGGLVTSKLNSNLDFQVIIGSEIKTEYGDVIGLFLQEDIKSRLYIEVLEEIRDQNAISVLAHPFRKEGIIPSDLISRIDCIEGFNARSKKSSNIMAYKLALKLGKPISSGSDAHMGFEIGRGRIKLEAPYSLLSYNSHNIISEGESSNYYYVHGMTIILEKLKRTSNLFKFNRG